MVEMTSGSTPCRISGSTMMALKTTPSISIASAMREQRRERERQAEPFHRRQREEGRQHHELALGEIDGLRGLPEQREADRRQRVDRAGGEAGNHQLEEVSHGAALRCRVQRERSWPPDRPAIRPIVR